MKFSNYHKIYKCDLSNGEGVRITIFLSGCIHACEGCYNESTWNPKSGVPLDHETIELLLSDCAMHDGISFSGGDPLHTRNRETVLYISKRFKELYPNKDIWLWTGFEFDDIKNEPIVSEIFKLVDVVIDGKYDKTKPATKPWRGSDNQNLIKIKEIS